MNNKLSHRFLALFMIVCMCATLVVLLPSGDTHAAVDDNYTVSLLHFNNPQNGSQTFTDESGKTWTAHNHAQTVTGVYKFGLSSASFDGTDDWIDTPENADFNVGTGNFTIDFWYRPHSFAAQAVIFSKRSSGSHYIVISQLTSGVLAAYLSSNGTSWDISGGTSMGTYTLDTWQHVALVRNGNSFLTFKDGSNIGSASSSASIEFNSGATINIGADNGGVRSLNGYIDEFRFSKGIARWTTNFTPPTSEYVPPPTPTNTANATQTFQAGQTATAANAQTATANAITATAIYNLTATSNAATTTAQYNLDLTATSNAATSTAQYFNNQTGTAAAIFDAQTATQAYINGQTATAFANLTATADSFTQTAAAWTPTFTSTATSTATASLTSTPIGSIYLEPKLTYGEFAIEIVLLCLGGLIFSIIIMGLLSQLWRTAK